MGIDFGSTRWELEREKLRFNACVVFASKRLYLSYRTANEDGSVMMASPFIDEVVCLLDKENRENIIEKQVSIMERVSFRGRISSIGEAVKAVNTNLRNIYLQYCVHLYLVFPMTFCFLFPYLLESRKSKA
jgi:ATP-dependent helicase/nuclease subunit B